MAKKSNPLFQALKSRSPKGEEPTLSMSVMQPKQMVTITTSQVPSLKSSKPGDSVSVSFTGVIHSLNRDGKAEVEIENFEDESEDFSSEKEPPMVRTSITPTPGAV